MTKKVIVILGNQLFDPKLIPLRPGSDVSVFMREDRGLCTHFRYHQHKIVFFLSAMRTYAEELRKAGYSVHYEELGETRDSYEDSLGNFLRNETCKEVFFFEVEDAFFERRLTDMLHAAKLKIQWLQSPMFLTSRSEFASYLSNVRKPFMKSFYERQRKRLKILIESDGSPTGGKWSFDTENREAVPDGYRAPNVPTPKRSAHDSAVIALVSKEFADHPGDAEDFWLPTDRAGARRWMKDFFSKRFRLFGPYEDAFSKSDPFLHHSVLTPFLNTGLVTPEECVTAAVREMNESDIPLNSAEGFIRQVIGWREFIRGIYRNFGDEQETSNFFGARNRLTDAWYSGKSGVEPLDDVVGKVRRYGYAHHIERLMVVGSLMVLLEVDPQEGYRWFMEMFVDSSDWVMGPNVYGMALFADGGIFATKPYICGSNYYRKMGYEAGDWCDGVDGLYWSFIGRHKAHFARNPRMSMMVRSFEKMDPDRMKRLNAAADRLRARLVVS